MPDNLSLASQKFSELTQDQHVRLYPSFAYRDERAEDWRIPVTAFVYEHGQDSVRQRVFLRLLQQVLQSDAKSLEDSDIFQQRVRGFLEQPSRGRNVVMKFGEPCIEAAARSRRSGQVRMEFSLSREAVPAALRNSRDPRDEDCIGQQIRRQVSVAPGDERCISDHVRIIAPRGISVISDIDDTIKISQVAHRRQLLHNTFVNPFATVPGMSALYQQWQSEGAAFHYVSSSPWQLFDPLSELLRENEFPEGSYHLRTYRFGDPSILRLFMAKKRNKYTIIKSIFRMFPKRRFILVGDSGEKDPEIYGKVARKFPHQIERILIRRVEGRAWTRERVAKAFRKVPRELWQAFRVPTQIDELRIQ